MNKEVDLAGLGISERAALIAAHLVKLDQEDALGSAAASITQVADVLEASVVGGYLDAVTAETVAPVPEHTRCQFALDAYVESVLLGGDIEAFRVLTLVPVWATRDSMLRALSYRRTTLAS